MRGNLAGGLALAASILLSGHSLAATVIDFSTPLNNSPNLGTGGNIEGYGNQLNFANNGINVTISAYGDTYYHTDHKYYLDYAQVASWPSGVGACNQQEGSIQGDYYYNSCSGAEHEVDTAGRDDLVVFFFDQTVNFENLTVDPFNNPGSDPNDRDITYWIGNVSSLPDLTNYRFNTLDYLPGFANGTHQAASSGFAPYTHSLSGTGNVLLVSGDYGRCKNWNATTPNECEAYKIKNIAVTAVPLPGAVLLFGSSLLGLMGLRSKHVRSA